MENQTPKPKVYHHYNHTDSCSRNRWTARECYEFMYARPWQQVIDYYSNVVKGRFTLSALFGNETTSSQQSLVRDDDETMAASNQTELKQTAIENRTGRWARVTFKIVLSYNGTSFDGWQRQPGLNTVQGLVEKSLGTFVDERKAKMLEDKCLPLEGCVVVAGRTDKGVTALQQVCSFYTWRKDVKTRDIEEAINSISLGELRALSVSEVSREFHPNFSAKWRRYLYIFPLSEEDGYGLTCSSENNGRSVSRTSCEHDIEFTDCTTEKNIETPDGDELQNRKVSTKFSISRVNLLLSHLQGKVLSYKMFARDTKASRNEGPPTECFIYHARAAEARLPCPDYSEGTRVMCIELVANRFLRRMVRVLVATSIRETAAGAEGDSLLKLIDATCRRATAPPAPPDGLCLADVGYTEFDPKNCLIK